MRSVLGWKPESVSEAFVSGGLVARVCPDNPYSGIAASPVFVLTAGLVLRTWGSLSVWVPLVSTVPWE